MKSLAFGSLSWGKPCFHHEPPSFTDLGRLVAYGGVPAEVATGERK